MSMTEPSGHQKPGGPGLPEIDIRERGGKRDGQQQASNRRLFFQFMAFSHPDPPRCCESLASLFERNGCPGVVYRDVNDPWGLATLTWTEQPIFFVETVQPMLLDTSVAGLKIKNELTMLGRTYATGHEPDLEHVLLQRPVDNVLRTGWDWAVWYPLRRRGTFARLDRQRQGRILREHAAIGMAYGKAELAHDVRLACHGLDANDNEFVIGLIGQELHPLSHVVQTMRATEQTSEYIQAMGPFFVGRVQFRRG